MVRSIYAPAEEKRLDFESWKQVPGEFKTRNQWLREGRKVKEGEKPNARVVYPRIVEFFDVPQRNDLILADLDDLLLITDPPTSLFHLNQTVPYNASSRTKAYEEFEDIFLRYSRRESYSLRTDWRSGNELEDWYTITANPTALRFHDRQLLTSQLIRQHINQKQIVGVKCTKLTRFILIDLDYHGRNQQVFEDQAEVLLNAFHGRGNWHFQVKRQDVTGLQMLCVFPEPMDLQVVTEKLETILKELDQQHADLAKRAKAAGMKSLAELEIYPDPNQSVRLPLCRDREMLLDKPLALVTHRNQQVQDVEGYIQWLNDPNREYMKKERILDYLHYFASPELGRKSKPIANNSDEQSETGDNLKSGWKGNLKRWLFQFWIEGRANGRSLNEHIAVLSRLAVAYGHPQSEIERKIKGFIAELPECAKASSQRLLKRKTKTIDRVVETTAKYAAEENGHQRDAVLSTKKLKTALARWSGFDPLDKSTWSVLGLKARSKETPNWTEDQKRDICNYLRKPLFVKDDELILRFVTGIVNLTLDKEREGNGWHKNYLRMWMKTNFPEINCGKAQKCQNILVALQELGIIHSLFKGKPGAFFTHWCLGELAQQAIGKTQKTTENPS